MSLQLQQSTKPEMAVTPGENTGVQRPDHVRRHKTGSVGMGPAGLGWQGCRCRLVIFRTANSGRPDIGLADGFA